MRAIGRRIGVATVLALCASGALAQAQVDLGQREYMANCAVCHGTSGNGAGFYDGMLTRKPTNLTILAKTNGGVFPSQRVYDVIDGRKDVPAHGPRDMPIWGSDYSVKGQGVYDAFGAVDPEAFARLRILALVDYLNRIQVK